MLSAFTSNLLLLALSRLTNVRPVFPVLIFRHRATARFLPSRSFGLGLELEIPLTHRPDERCPLIPMLQFPDLRSDPMLETLRLMTLDGRLLLSPAVMLTQTFPPLLPMFRFRVGHASIMSFLAAPSALDMTIRPQRIGMFTRENAAIMSLVPPLIAFLGMLGLVDLCIAIISFVSMWLLDRTFRQLRNPLSPMLENLPMCPIPRFPFLSRSIMIPVLGAPDELPGDVIVMLGNDPLFYNLTPHAMTLVIIVVISSIVVIVTLTTSP